MVRRNLVKRLLPAVLVAVVAVLAFACGGEEAGVPSTQLAPVQELRLNLGTEPQTIDPNLAADAVSVGVVRQLYSALTRTSS